MNKKNLLLLTINIILFAASSLHAQVGINTDNPQQLLHVDGKKDNPTTGSPSADQQKDDVVITEEGRLGIGTIAPTESLDVDGRARIRNTDYLESSAIARLYVDENGLVGKANILPEPQKAVYFSSDKQYNLGKFDKYIPSRDWSNPNLYYYLPIVLEDAKYNTLGVTYSPATGSGRNFLPAAIRIPEDGIYLLTGSVTIRGSLNDDGNGYGYIDYQIQDQESSLQLLYYGSGTRETYTRESLNAGASYTYTFPTKLAKLSAGTLIRIRMNNGRGYKQHFNSPGTYPGLFHSNTFSQLYVDGSGDVPSYTLSIIKL